LIAKTVTEKTTKSWLCGRHKKRRTSPRVQWVGIFGR